MLNHEQILHTHEDHIDMEDEIQKIPQDTENYNPEHDLNLLRQLQ